jgi:hypothetical protein
MVLEWEFESPILDTAPFDISCVTLTSLCTPVIPSLERLRQEDLKPRPLWATQRDLVLKKTSFLNLIKLLLCKIKVWTDFCHIPRALHRTLDLLDSNVLKRWVLHCPTHSMTPAL